MSNLSKIVQRNVGKIARECLKDSPVLLLEGARSVGKSTAMHELGAQLGYQLFDLDQPRDLAALQLDSSLILGADGLVGIDEYQKLPVLLDEIKSQLNKTSSPCQFLLAGSTREESIAQVAQALTGRITKLQILPLAQVELEGNSPQFVKAIFADPTAFFSDAKQLGAHLAKQDYIMRVVKGGFPLALAAKTPAALTRWFRNYLRLTFERDSHAIYQFRNHDLLKPIFTQISANTASILNVNKIASANGIDHHTANAYITVLENLFLVRKLPAWGMRASTGATKAPKIHVLDSGIAAHAAHLGIDKLQSANTTYATEFGHLLETFVVGEIAKEISWQNNECTLSHWRSSDKYEIDIILENEDGKIVAIEVKASTSVHESDFKSIDRLSERTGSAFCAGIVLYLGNRVLHRTKKTFAAPLDLLWVS